MNNRVYVSISPMHIYIHIYICLHARYIIIWLYNTYKKAFVDLLELNFYSYVHSYGFEITKPY